MTFGFTYPVAGDQHRQLRYVTPASLDLTYNSNSTAQFSANSRLAQQRLWLFLRQLPARRRRRNTRPSACTPSANSADAIRRISPYVEDSLEGQLQTDGRPRPALGLLPALPRGKGPLELPQSQPDQHRYRHARHAAVRGKLRRRRRQLRLQDPGPHLLEELGTAHRPRLLRR